MTNITMSGCKCVCDAAQIIEPTKEAFEGMDIVRIVLLALVVIMVIIGLIVGFKKLKDQDQPKNIKR